jgi:hypothetical protein
MCLVYGICKVTRATTLYQWISESKNTQLVPVIQNVFLFIVAYYKATANVKSITNNAEDEKSFPHYPVS